MKQERSLFTAALKQTSNVPTAIIRPRPTVGLWSPIPSIRSAIASLHHAARLLLDRCATAPETRLLLAVSRAHPSRVQRRPMGREAVIPRPVVRGPMAVVLPRSRSPVPSHRPFWACHCRLCWSSAGGVGVPSSAGNGAGSRRWHPLRAPAGDPTPITQVKVRTRAKSTTAFSLSKPVPGFKTGYRFPFNIPVTQINLH